MIKFTNWLNEQQKHRNDYNHSKNGFVGGNQRYKDSKGSSLAKQNVKKSRLTAKRELKKEE